MTTSVSSIKIPDASKAFNRLAHIPLDENRSKAKAYFVEKESADVKPQSLLAIADPLVALGKRLDQTPWMQATREDILGCIRDHVFRRGAHLAKTPGESRPLAASTRHQWWSYIKGFYRYMNDEETPRMLRRPAFPKRNAMEERGRDLALQPEVLAKLIAGATSPRDRCIVLFLLETGFRVSEVAALRLKDMEFDGTTYWFRLPKGAPRLKTGVREVDVGLIQARREFEAWLAVHPRRHDDAPVFVNLSNHSRRPDMTGQGISDVVARAARRAGIKVHAHMLRHTSASLKVLSGWNNEAIRLTHGWEKGSDMPDYYSHLKPYYKDLVRKANGLPVDDGTVLDHMASWKCKLCGARNPITAIRCHGCGADASQAGQVHEQRKRNAVELDFVAPYALQAFQDVLILAIARARGFTEATA